MTTSVFAEFENKAWPFEFAGEIHVDHLVGGTPFNPKVAESWIKSQFTENDDMIRKMVAEIMAEREVAVDAATKIAQEQLTLNGFRREAKKGLYIGGRQLKAAIKEAANVAVGAGKLDSRGWGATNKGSRAFLAEHIVVVEDRLYLGRMEPTDVQQRFVHSRFGAAIVNEEYVEDVDIPFTVRTDWELTPEQWAMIWLTGQEQGIGASRSQGFGRYTVTKWEATRAPKEPKPVKAVARSRKSLA
jgi:hypothetical protein